MTGTRQGLFAPRQFSWGRGGDDESWQGEIAHWGGEILPEQELEYSASHEVELKFGGRTVSLSDPAGVDSLPTKPGIYFIYINGAIWYVGKSTNIRERFQERLKAFADFKIPPAQYLPLLRPVTVRWYEMVRFTDPKGSSFRTRGAGKKAKWTRISTSLGLLRSVEQHFISKYGTNLLGNKTTECIRGGGPITIVYDFGASKKPRENLAATIFAEKCS